MRRVALSAVACMIAVLAAAPSPTAAEATTAVAPSLDAPAMASLWRREEGAAAADDAALHPIHVYFDIESDARRVEAAGACVEAEATLEGRLACKAEALGPTAAERAALERWLAPLGRTLTRAEYFEQREKGCFVDWNAAHCRGASVGEAKAVFGRTLEFGNYHVALSEAKASVETPVKTSTKRSTAAEEARAEAQKKAAHTWVLTEGTLDVSGAAPFARVQHVSGLQPYNHKEQRARHMGRALEKWPDVPAASQPRNRPSSAKPIFTMDELEKNKNANKEDEAAAAWSTAQHATGVQSGDDTTPYSNIPWLTRDDEQPNQWSTPETGRGAMVVHADFDMAYVIIMCADGMPSSWSNYQIDAADWTSLCDDPNESPSSVDLTVRAGVGLNATLVETLPMLPKHCNTAWMYNSQSSAVVCRVYIRDAIARAVRPYQEFVMSTVTQYQDSDLPATGRAVNYLEATTYIAPSWDIDNTLIEDTVPPPTLITPSRAGSTPASIRKQYGVDSTNQGGGQVQGVVEFTDALGPAGGFNISDLTAYMEQIVGVDTYSAESSVQVLGDGSIVSTGETTLDIELVSGLAPQANSYINCISYGTESADYATYADALAGFAGSLVGGVRGSFGTASVWSVSYGGPEWSSSASYRGLMRHIDLAFAHASDAGVTVTASSGDMGAYFYEFDYLGDVNAIFTPNWPATSPNVLAVGATAYDAPTGKSTLTETACMARRGNVITSGGGFSAVFDQPAYQSLFVPNTVRGMPDVAALGAWITTIIAGERTPLFGTSASSPIVAAMLTLMNHRRMAPGSNLHTLRQVPKMMYSAYGNSTRAFTPVNSGDNCGGELLNSGLVYNMPSYSHQQCYTTHSGAEWSAVTGIGTLNWDVLAPMAVDWNPAPMHFPATHKDKGSSDGVAIGIGVCVVVVLAIGGVVALRMMRSRQRRQQQGVYVTGQPVPSSGASTSGAPLLPAQHVQYAAPQRDAYGTEV